MAKSSALIQQFARAGALARLSELKAEIAEIERVFPGITATSDRGRRGPGRPRAAANAEGENDGQTAPARGRKRRTMSAAARKAIGDAQRKRWAAQKTQGAKRR